MARVALHSDRNWDTTRGIQRQPPTAKLMADSGEIRIFVSCTSQNNCHLAVYRLWIVMTSDRSSLHVQRQIFKNVHWHAVLQRDLSDQRASLIRL